VRTRRSSTPRARSSAPRAPGEPAATAPGRGSSCRVTPFVTSHHALLTTEWTPLEPGVVDHELYVRGLGTVLEQTVEGGDERNELVSSGKGR
jgi:hypothetical protein